MSQFPQKRLKKNVIPDLARLPLISCGFHFDGDAKIVFSFTDCWFIPPGFERLFDFRIGMALDDATFDFC